MHDVLLHVFVGSFSLYDLLLLLLILYTLHDVIGIIVLGLFIIDDGEPVRLHTLRNIFDAAKHGFFIRALTRILDHGLGVGITSIGLWVAGLRKIDFANSFAAKHCLASRCGFVDNRPLWRDKDTSITTTEQLFIGVL